MNLRALPAGRSCLVRMPGICNHRPDDCVLAHAHMAGLRGTAGKAFDLIGAWACSACHNEYDRRTRLVDADQARLWFYEGVLRTIDVILAEGLMQTAASNEALFPTRKKASKGRAATPSKIAAQKAAIAAMGRA